MRRKRELDRFVGSSYRCVKRGTPGLHRILDGLRQRIAMLLGQFDFAARLRVLVAAAKHQEEGNRSGMRALDGGLGVTGVIAADLIKRGGQRRVVACITEQNGKHASVAAFDANYRDGMIHGRGRILPNDLSRSARRLIANPASPSLNEIRAGTSARTASAATLTRAVVSRSAYA